MLNLPFSEDIIKLNPHYFAGSIAKPHQIEKQAVVGGNAINESSWQKQVLDLLLVKNWIVHAERPARTAKGWCTPIQGDAGFPDIVAVKPPRLLILELKTEGGKLSASQEKWLLALQKCYQVEVHVLRPGDYEKLLRILGD